MKRKMVFAGTAWTAGLLSAVVFGISVTVPAILIIAVLLCRFVFKFNFKSIFFMMVSFGVAFGFYNAYDMLVYRKTADFAGKEITFVGTVTDFKDYAENNSVYYLDGRINGGTKSKLMVYTDSMICETGDTVKLECTVKLPENDFLFKSKDYYKSKGIYLRTDTVNSVSVKSCTGFSLRKILYRYREKVIGVVEKSVPFDEAGMINAMLFGDKSGIYDDDMTMLYRTGIGHVTAVSGLHLVLFCSLISFAMNKLKINRVTEFVFCEIFMLLFALCCGMSVSVMRAFVMMTLINLAPLFFRCTDSLNSICIAVILLTLQNPFVITNQSFVLSVSGALGAGVFAPYMTNNMKTDNRLRKFVKNAVYLLCVSFAVTPMSIICFGEFSLVSPLSNLILTPVCMTAIFIAMTASLVIFINPVYLFKISGIICRIILNLSRIVGNSKYTSTKLSGESIPSIIVILIIFCVISYLIFKSSYYSMLSVMISILVVFNSASLYNFFGSKNLKIALLGKSETGVIVISKGCNADVIDLNGKAKNCRYVLKYLEKHGISSINSIILLGKPYSAMASYDSGLALFNVENVVIPAETYVRENTVICGCKPRYSDFDCWSADYGKYLISVNKNDNNYYIATNFGEYHFQCIDGGDGNRKYKPNTVFYINNNGKSGYRRLENG